MKINKFLFLTPSVALATFMPLVSCGGDAEAERIIHAIFDPLDVEPFQIDGGEFTNKLKEYSSDELNKELIYDLFLEINTTKYTFDGYHMKELVDKGDVGIKTIINNCTLAFDGDDLKASFLGYVSFIFLKEHESFYVNDYIMYTYEFKNLKVIPYDLTCSLYYQDIRYPDVALGFVKTRCFGGEDEWLRYIKMVNTNQTEAPTNSKNYFVK
ncbi:MAG: hypothetical protein ACOQNY_01105 [Mycoplasmoidaceae bacterium]